MGTYCWEGRGEGRPVWECVGRGGEGLGGGGGWGRSDSMLKGRPRAIQS